MWLNMSQEQFEQCLDQISDPAVSRDLRDAMPVRGKADEAYIDFVSNTFMPYTMPLQVDGDAVVSDSDDGAWVACWIWVHETDARESPMWPAEEVS